MEPWVFHCTPCGHPHAGECPPKKDVAAMFRDAVAEANDSWKVPVFTGLPVVGQAPPIGSRWSAETRNDPTDVWYNNETFLFEVTAVAGPFVKIAGLVASTGQYTAAKIAESFHVDHWQPAGKLNNHGVWLRFT